MDFMSIVREKASAIAIGAVKTSGVVMETVKSNLAIADKEQESAKTLKELGELIYEAYKKDEEFNADAVAEKCVLLDQYESEIEELRNKIKDLKKIKSCPACNSTVKAEHNFCPNCGAEIKDAPIENSDEEEKTETEDKSSIDELNP
jgi:hypothetical protein